MDRLMVEHDIVEGSIDAIVLVVHDLGLFWTSFDLGLKLLLWSFLVEFVRRTISLGNDVASQGKSLLNVVATGFGNDAQAMDMTLDSSTTRSKLLVWEVLVDGGSKDIGNRLKVVVIVSASDVEEIKCVASVSTVLESQTSPLDGIAE